VTAPGSVVVVANPTAGDGKAGRLIGKVNAILEQLGVDHEIRVSGSPEELEQLAHAAGEQGGIVAVLGGDGSVNLAVNGLAGTSGTLAVLPAGTGDDFAKAIDVGKLEDATRLLADPKTVDVDLIGVTAGVEQRRFINVAGAGFDSEVSDVAAGMRRRLGSRAHYAIATVKTLPRFVPARFHLDLDGSSIDVDAMLVVVGNSYAYGGGMKVLPQASIVDGALDICIVTAMSKAAFLRAFPKVYVGKHATHPNVMMLRGTDLKVEANRRVSVFADGEKVGSLPAVFTVLPKALPVVVGPNAKAIR
jgi:diacylglycerol kinase (ATP)